MDIRRISVLPKTFVPGESDALRVRFVAGAPVPARVEIADADGAVVRSFPVDSVGREGTEIVWDGRTATGEPAESGVYLYRIYALDDRGRVRGQYGTDPSADGEEVLAQRFTFDPETGTVEFILPEPARVRLRMGLHHLPVLRTYYGWEPLEAGRHRIEWDGLDVTGSIRLSDHPDLRVNLEARSLPENSFYLRRDAVDTRDPCIELCFEATLVGATGTTGDGKPIVGDEVNLRVDVRDARLRSELIDARFELMVFLDTVYLHEDEDGVVPFNYRVDTRDLNPGTHLLTVNLLSYDQRAGVRTIEFVKAEP